jgi:hypothetical protein
MSALIAALWITMTPSATDPAVAELLARFDALPDLTEIARTRRAGDVYAERRRLEADYRAQGRSFRVSEPYRSPPSPCSTGAHRVPRVRHRLVDAGRTPAVEAEVWEEELHEARAHGGLLPGAVKALLSGLPARGR